MSSAIKLIDVSKTYDMGKVKVPALCGVDLDIKKGEFVAIMGPSGSGKSTMMHIIGCLDLPTKGKVILDGEDISKLTEDQLARLRGKKIGFVFQQFNLLAHQTAIENVMLPMIFQNGSSSDKRKRALELLDMVGLKERANHKPNEMSGGEKQRVAIARALSNDPEIILADEPTGNLDSKTGEKVMDDILELHEKFKKTIIIVTHDPYIADYAKKGKIYNLKDGKLVKNHVTSKKYTWKD